MRRVCCVFTLVFCWGVAFALTCHADAFTYTFDSPNFTLGATTPLLNVAPNVGASTLRTSFTDSVNANGYSITSIPENGLISGQSLFAATVTSPLTLTFSTPITQLSLVFAIDIPPVLPTGFLRLVTPAGSFDQVSSVVGGGNGFQGGTLNFSTSVPFTTATLQGFTSGEASNTQFDIDNLTLSTTTPEPSTLLLTGLGLSALAGWRYKRM